MPDLSEPRRRKAGADGDPVRLADGHDWLFARPAYRAGARQLAEPDVDDAIEDLFERLVLHEPIPLGRIWEAARALLRHNYDLDDSELSELLSVRPGGEAQALADAVLDALFGPEAGSRGYCDWIRATLLANGLADVSIPSRDLPNVLAILVATNRTVPVTGFADACRAARERVMLDTLI